MPLYTLGYAGRTPAVFFRILAQAGVEVLCDVRRDPVSRKPGFSKKTLAAACSGAGIRYEHLPELGVPAAQRRKLKTRADRQAYFARYERALPRRRAALERIAAWLRAGETVAMTCLEADPADCHRLRLARALASDAGHL